MKPTVAFRAYVAVTCDGGSVENTRVVKCRRAFYGRAALFLETAGQAFREALFPSPNCSPGGQVLPHEVVHVVSERFGRAGTGKNLL